MNMLGLGTYESDEEIEEEDAQPKKDVKVELTLEYQKSSSVSNESKMEISCDFVTDESEVKLEIADDVFQPSSSQKKEQKEQEEQNEQNEQKEQKEHSLVRNKYSHLDELPPSPTKPANPKTIRKISEYLELKEISGFNLTEVR